MKYKVFLAALLASASPALAQDIISASGSNADAVSGSQSGAQSDNNSSQQQNNAGIGNSDSVSVSDSTALSGSQSASESYGNQQGQALDSSNSNANTSQQAAINEQGVQVSTVFNTTSRKISEVRTNAPIPLAASSSFSSDYCGGTASGGASVAPLGISIGGAAPTFDDSCRYLRVAEKAGMLGANYYNMRQYDMGYRAMSMMAWAMCMAGPQQDNRRRGNKDNATMEACLALGLLGSDTSPAPHSVQQEVTPMEAARPNVTSQPDQYKVPRGDLEYQSVPIIQGENKTTAMVAMPPRP
jgi:hypothetical protein